ncbi:hypothetical protein [Candidatus Stoquefichus massiliensis]|uniref:hypothetical protein n=1 Tax=Candidatus Stoquefichus massiliensis TaxID=1470350 RepID=UPI000484D667|nr:hypothetical protein [Candidatus Stoquefichus massiliensis]
MKRVIEYFGLGVLMVLAGSLLESLSVSGDYSLFSISNIFIWSGLVVLFVGEGLFIYKGIIKIYHMYKEFTSSIK